jgi:hypothetical protein
MKVIARTEIDQVIAELFPSSCVSDIFAASFRWILGQRRFFITDAYDHASFSVRECKEYLAASDAMGDILLGPAFQMADVPPSDIDTILPELNLRELKNVVRSRIKWADVKDVFPIVIALLDQIDRYWGELIVNRLYACEIDGVIPLPPTSAIPRPWPAFGIRTPTSRRPPQYEFSVEFTLLERYFEHLTTFPRARLAEPAPVLHPQSCREPADVRLWTVAMVSILADPDDVEWDKNEVLFWGRALKPTATLAVMRRLIWALSECRAAGADIILIPELNVDQGMGEVIKRFCAEMGRERRESMPLVVYGALHEASPGEAGLFKNRPQLLVPGGSLDWPYWKREPSIEKLDRGDREWIEALGEKSSKIPAIDLPFGRLVVLICKDFLDAETRLVIEQMRSSIVLVLSMTNGKSVQDFTAEVRPFAQSSRFCPAEYAGRNTATP